jgi:hypothetical protein
MPNIAEPVWYIRQYPERWIFLQNSILFLEHLRIVREKSDWAWIIISSRRRKDLHFPVIFAGRTPDFLIICLI